MKESIINLTLIKEKDMLKNNSPDEEIRSVIIVEPIQSMMQNVRPGVDIIFLLDSSDSMQEKFYDTEKTKKQIVAEAALNSIDLLADNDTISVISFNTTAILMLNHERKSAKTKITEMINEILNHSGQTNFEEALKLALYICKNKINNVVKIVFLTDGNQFGGSENRALDFANEIVSSGVSIDVMGIGGDYNFDVMRKYSGLCGGISENIVDIKKTNIIFRKILKSGQSAVAVNTVLNILFASGIRDVKLFQTAPEKCLLNDRINITNTNTYANINIGSISNGAPKQYAISCFASIPDATNKKIADVSLSFTNPATNENYSQDTQWFINLSSFSDNDVIFDRYVTDCFIDIELLLDYESAIKNYNNGNVNEAVKKLKRMVDSSYRLGKKDEAETYFEYLNKIANNEKLTQEDINKISYTSSRQSSVRSTILTDDNDLF